MPQILNQKSGKLPDLPVDLSIGSQHLKGRKSIVLKGQLVSETGSEKGHLDGKTRGYLHDKGIRLQNDRSGYVVEIHDAQIIRLETINKSFPQSHPVILRNLFKILAIVTLGAIVQDLTGYKQRKTKTKPCLVIHYWDPFTKSPDKVLISGRKKRIEEFMEAYR